MNRHERRTRGKALLKRMNVLKSSSLLQDLDLKDLPQEVIDKLIAGECENKLLQEKYNKSKKLLSEAIDIEIELNRMREDLGGKLSKTSQENI